jgi:hypothetical protein
MEQGYNRRPERSATMKMPQPQSEFWMKHEPPSSDAGMHGEVPNRVELHFLSAAERNFPFWAMFNRKCSLACTVFLFSYFIFC